LARPLPCRWLHPSAQPYPRSEVPYAPSIDRHGVNATSLLYMHFSMDVLYKAQATRQSSLLPLKTKYSICKPA
jgi:hypothetical protein